MGKDQVQSPTLAAPAMPSGFRTPNSSSLLQPLTKREEEEQVAALAARIGGHTSVDELIMHSDLKNVEDIVNRLNQGRENPATDSVFGTLIPKAHLGVISKNGTTSVVGPGRYRLYNPRADWVGEPVAINGDLRSVTRGPVTVLRVPNGHYGLATLGNKPLILSSENGGLHAFLTAQFRFQEFVRIDTRSISHGSLHIVRVPRGSYASVTESDIPGFLPPGVHAFNSATFNFVRVHELGHAPIRHQTITRFYVPEGSIGLAWHDSDPVFCTQAGVYLVDSPMFEFVRTVDYGEPHIALGARKIVTVQEGQVGVSHRNGELAVLPPGRHDIADPRHTFDEFLSTQQQCLTLAKEDQHSEQMMRCESKELASIGVQASVFYHIRDPRLAIVKIGSRRNIERFINETATAVITTIIRSTSLADIARAGGAEPGAKVTANDDDDVDGESKGNEDFDPSTGPFFDRLKTDFIARLQENFDMEYGIFMLNVRIGDFKVLDTELAQSISNHALATAETQANLANLEGRRKIDLVNKDSDARMGRIQADADANKALVEAKAKAEALKQRAQAEAAAATVASAANAQATKDKAGADAAASTMASAAKAQATRDAAGAEANAATLTSAAKAQVTRDAAAAHADAMLLEAEAKAKSIRMIAEAEAEATRMRGEAEADRARKLGEIAFGREVTLAEVQAKMVTESLHGVEKVVYLPTDMQKNSFGLFGASQMGAIQK